MNKEHQPSDFHFSHEIMARLILFVLLFWGNFSVFAQSNVLIPFRKGDLWGYADTNKVIVIPPTYHSTDLFRFNRGRIRMDSLYGYINKKGEKVINPQFLDARGFENGFGGTVANVKINSNDVNFSNIDSMGNSCKIMRPGCGTKDTAELMGLRIIEEGKVGFVFKKVYRGALGELKIPVQYEDIKDNRMGLLYAKKDGKWGMINEKNETILPFEYDNIMASTTFYAHQGGILVKDGLFGFVDTKGNILISPKYAEFNFWEMAMENTFYPRYKIAKVKNKEGKFGYVDMKGQEFWED